MKLPQRLSLAALVISLALPAACGKKDAPPDAGSASHATAPATTPPATAAATTAGAPDVAAAAPDAASAQAPAPDAAANAQPIPKVDGILGAPALAHLPADPLFVWAGVPYKLWQGLGLDGLMTKYLAAMPESGNGMLARVKGVLDGTLGIDPNGVAGLVWPDAMTEGFVAFLPVSDRAKLEAALADVAGQASLKLVKEARGDGTLYSIEGTDKGALFLTDTVAYVAFGKGIDAKALASVVATTTPDKSVLSLERYAKAAAGAGQADAALYLDFKRVIGMFVARPHGDGRQTGALVELMESVSGSAGTLTLAVNLHDDAIEAAGRIDVGEGSVLAKLIQASGKVMPAVVVADGAPAFLLAGKIDWKAYLALGKLVIASQGENFAEGLAQANKKLGMDVEKDLVEKLSGEIGLVATGDVGEAMRSGKGPSALGGAAYIGFTDAELPKRLLGIVAGALHKGEGGAAPETLRVPLEGRTLLVRVVGTYLVAATDEASFDRFTKLDAAATMPDKLGNDRLKALVSRTDLGALMLVDQTLAAGIFMTGRAHSSVEEVAPANLPKAKAAKWAELQRLEKELATLREKEDRDENATTMTLVSKLGMTAEAAWVEGSTIVWHIGQYPRGGTVKETIAGFVDAIVNRSGASADPKQEEKIDALRAKINALQGEIWDTKLEAPAPK